MPVALLLAGFAVHATLGPAAHRTLANEWCPQPRFTGKAPPELYNRADPLTANRSNRNAGEELYEDLSNPSCVVCHGEEADGAASWPPV